ncbi:unnamed protein product [Sphagnum compactum]
MRIKRIMNSQCVKGPSSHLMMGNVPEIRILEKAEAEKDMKTGDYDIPRITIPDLDLIKQVLTNKDHLFAKSPLAVRSSKPIIGKGLVTTDGEEWALHCRIVNPAFHHEKLKATIVAMEKSESSMVNEWEKKVKDSGSHAELEVGDYMTHVIADIIAFTAFGSNYEKGKKVLLPTLLNIKIILTQISISSSLKQIIQSRKDMVKRANNTSYGNDLLGLMLSAAIEETTIKGGKVHFGMQPLMGNCKTFCIAGHETMTTLLTWAMMLASHTNWQECAREEVIEVCGHNDHPIDLDMICFGGNKISLVVVLQWFHFHLSPNYRHAPHHKVTMKPKYEVPMILECL